MKYRNNRKLKHVTRLATPTASQTSLSVLFRCDTCWSENSSKKSRQSKSKYELRRRHVFLNRLYSRQSPLFWKRRCVIFSFRNPFSGKNFVRSRWETFATAATAVRATPANADALFSAVGRRRAGARACW